MFGPMRSARLPEPMTRDRLASLARFAPALLPPLFAAQVVLNRYALTPAAPPEIVRPLLVLVGVGLVGFLLALAAFRNVSWAALVGSLLMVVLIIDPVPAVVLAGLIVGRLFLGLLRRRRGHGGPLRANDPAVRLAAVYGLVLAVFGIWSGFVTQPAPQAYPTLDVPAGVTPSAGPNIYLLMLDGYPRADTLATTYGYDDSGFETELAKLGLTVATRARSDYNKTWLTQVTLLDGQYLDVPEVTNPPAGAPAQDRLLYSLLNSSAVLSDLRQRGYRLISIPSPVESTDLLADAEVRSAGHLSSFEIALASSSIVSWIAPQQTLDFLAHDLRDAAVSQLKALQQEAESGRGSPKIVVTHLMSPHPPFVLGEEPSYLNGCFPRGCKVWALTLGETGLTLDQYTPFITTQVDELNGLVVDAVSTIVSSDPTAIVVVYSDHGSRYSLNDLDEHFRVLFAARTPGQPNLFGDDVALVNVFRRILTAYFGEDHPDLPYRSWVSDWTQPLILTERTP